MKRKNCNNNEKKKSNGKQSNDNVVIVSVCVFVLSDTVAKINHKRPLLLKRNTATYKTKKYGLYSYCISVCRRKPNIYKMKFQKKKKKKQNKNKKSSNEENQSKDKQNKKEKREKGKIDHVAKMGR